MHWWLDADKPVLGHQITCEVVAIHAFSFVQCAVTNWNQLEKAHTWNGRAANMLARWKWIFWYIEMKLQWIYSRKCTRYTQHIRARYPRHTWRVTNKHVRFVKLLIYASKIENARTLTLENSHAIVPVEYSLTCSWFCARLPKISIFHSTYVCAFRKKIQ